MDRKIAEEKNASRSKQMEEKRNALSEKVRVAEERCGRARTHSTS